MVSRVGNAVAEISTGARNRNENGFCKPPVKNSRRGELCDVQREQSSGIARLEPLHRIEGDLQSKVEQCRQPDDRHAGNDRNVEFESMRDDEDRRELPQRCEPAQPQDGIQPDIAARMAEIGGVDVGHSSKLSRAENGPQMAPN